MEQRRHHIAEVFRDSDAAAAQAEQFAAQSAQATAWAATQQKGAGSDGA